MTRVEFIEVSGTAAPWEHLGFTVVDSTIWLLGTSIRLVGDTDAPPGDEGAVTSWSLSGLDSTAGSSSSGSNRPAPIESIDGLATTSMAPVTPQLVEHGNGALGLDHVVVLTGSLERTSTALESATGAPLKRIRDLGSMRQGFHRIGSGGLIVEIVERAEWGDEPAAFWGFVVNVIDLDATVAALGDELISAARDAVQPGRRIATVRRRFGLGVPLAFMSP